MRIKNLEHGTFAKIQQEVVTTIADVGLPALFVNTLGDIEKITRQNEYLNQDIRIWIIGELPDIDWVNVAHCDLSKDKELIEKGEIVHHDFQINNQHINLSASKIEHYQPGLISSIQPLFTVICIYKPDVDSSFETLRLLADDLPWVHLIDFDHCLPASLKKELSQKLIQFEYTEITDNIEVPNLVMLFNQNSQEKQSIHTNYLSINQLKKTVKTISLIAGKELNNIISKKAITQQKILQIPDSRNSNVNDCIAKLKQIIQQYSVNYEKSTITSTELFIQSESHRGIKQTLSELENQTIIFKETPKTKNIELSLETKFENQLKGDLHQKISKKCATDVQIFIDTINVLEKEIEQLLDSQGIVFQRTNMKYITQNDIDYFLSQCFNRKIDYSGTAPNKGLYEYFSAARKFQMVFFMMASIFGVSGLIKKYQFVSIPLSIVLLGYGIINVSKSVAKERVENEEKETKSAMEAIERWLKDIGSDMSRTWTKILLDTFKSQLNILNSETETALKINLTQRNTETEDERRKQQKSLQTFELSERKIENVHRSVQTMDRNIQRLLSDSRTGYNQILRAERDGSRDTTSATERRISRSERRSDT